MAIRPHRPVSEVERAQALAGPWREARARSGPSRANFDGARSPSSAGPRDSPSANGSPARVFFFLVDGAGMRTAATGKGPRKTPRICVPGLGQQSFDHPALYGWPRPAPPDPAPARPAQHLLSPDAGGKPAAPPGHSRLGRGVAMAIVVADRPSPPRFQSVCRRRQGRRQVAGR